MCDFGGTSQRLCISDQCKYCFEKSFASHEKAKFWSKKNDKNPRQIFKGTKVNYIFDCDICKHEFSTRLTSVVTENRWCSYCSSQKFCENDECEFCYEKSFMSHPKAKFWSKKNDKSAGEYFKGSDKEVYFTCNDCSHDFLMRISNVSCLNTWCSYCSNKKNCTIKNCEACLSKILKKTKII
jgi:hypothetical protein